MTWRLIANVGAEKISTLPAEPAAELFALRGQTPFRIRDALVSEHFYLLRDFVAGHSESALMLTAQGQAPTLVV